MSKIRLLAASELILTLVRLSIACVNLLDTAPNVARCADTSAIVLSSRVIAFEATIAAAIVASNAITRLDNTIADVSAQRATFGAVSNRLTHAIDNLTNVKINSEAARSRILDTDYSAATSELARTQIIQQAGTAMLAQANALPATVLALLQ